MVQVILEMMLLLMDFQQYLQHLKDLFAILLHLLHHHIRHLLLRRQQPQDTQQSQFQ